MLSNDFKVALRHLWRRKIYSIIILLSLTIGFTCTNLLISFLIAEVNTDSFHANKDRTFQLFSNDPFGSKGDIAYIPFFVGDYLTGNYPEVEDICRMSSHGKVVLETEAGEFNDIILFSTDSAFFTCFDFPLAQGSVQGALSPESIVLSEEKAKILFDEPDVVGKLITLKTADTMRLVTVSGVVAPGPEKSHLTFDAIIHHTVLKNKARGGATYALLNNASQHEALIEKINEDPQRPGLIGTGKMHYTLEPLAKSYFNPTNKMPYMTTRSETFIWIGLAVSGLIFFMSGFNFINLFLLSLQGRKKEVGIKKTLGLSLPNLIKSSCTEVLLYISAAFALSLFLTLSFLTSFNDMLNATLDINYLFRLDLMIIIGLVVFLLAALVVIVSALQQWKVRPVNLMKKNQAARTTFNTPFFLIQFVISVTLIICAITIIRQMHFVENAPLGFNRSIIQLQAPNNELSSTLPALKQQLAGVAGIDHVSICSGNPISGNAIVRYELENGEFYTPYVFEGDEDFVKTLNLTLLEGTPGTHDQEGKLVNETFVRLFNFQHPVGEKIPGTDDRIVGVVKDFTCGSFKTKIPPVIISFSQNAQRILIDYQGQQVSSLMPLIKKSWDRVFPDYAFTYQVIQDDLLKKYKEDKFFYKLIVVASVISMIVSCFGLFALSWSVTQGRIKEIGIRKVLGATTRDILYLLTTRFVKRTVMAFMISAPVGYLLMDKWLDNFVNKITLDASIFLYAGILVILIALLTLSLNTIRAAVQNPVDELKTE